MGGVREEGPKQSAALRSNGCCGLSAVPPPQRRRRWRVRDAAFTLCVKAAKKEMVARGSRRQAACCGTFVARNSN